MSNGLNDLDDLIVKNWGLLYELHARAETARRSMLDECREQYVATGDMDQHGLKLEDLYRSGASWYVAFPGGGFNYLSYVQLEIETGTPRPAVTIFTSFRTIKGLGTIATKESVPKELRAAMGSHFDGTGSTQTTVKRTIELEESEAQLVSAAVEELQRQTPVAHALREFLMPRLPK